MTYGECNHQFQMRCEHHDLKHLDMNESQSVDSIEQFDFFSLIDKDSSLLKENLLYSSEEISFKDLLTDIAGLDEYFKDNIRMKSEQQELTPGECINHKPVKRLGNLKQKIIELFIYLVIYLLHLLKS